jgi:hypothetical protein
MSGIEPEGDAVTGRKLLMWNDDVEISLCRPNEEMDYFFRNGEGDEVIFVHEGSGLLETICYFRLDDPRPLPSLVTVKRGRYAHGFFALADPVHGLKVGLHKGGVEVEGCLEGAPDPAVVEQVVDWTRERFQLADPEPAAAQTCLYTTLPDDEFVLERRGRVVVGSACSGHGFKFAPAVGERLARLATSS